MLKMGSSHNVLISLSLLCLIAFLINRSEALSCIPCDPGKCESVKNCAYGLTKDICGCCDRCAKGPGEECGGVWNNKLSCGKGLTCVPNKINRDLPGRCRATGRSY